MRIVRTALLLCLAAVPADAAQTCRLDFTIEITQGVGTIRPGTHLPGHAEFTTHGPSIRQEGGSTGHLAMGHMTLGESIAGSIWTLVTTSRGHAADLVGVYAQDVQGLSFAGLDYTGPMALTLFGAPGTRPEDTPPLTQAEWDDLDMRRSFSLHAQGVDMLAGDVVQLAVDCG
ncbi:hypothetical protein V8J82_10410 [Gymnodinialimonas sp. 2305UL16-5]|uniref:hypothetical protein n=1 Tax=Gymnodinialimonas mytili TaxID=3126503 RepID=UPI003096D7C5